MQFTYDSVDAHRYEFNSILRSQRVTNKHALLNDQTFIKRVSKLVNPFNCFIANEEFPV